MRKRLVTIYSLLLILVLAALEVPLAVTLAGRETQRLVADRMADAIRFATLAEPALRTGETVTLRAELIRYDQLFGISSAVIDQDGTGVVVSRDRAWLNDAAVARETRRALTGQEAAAEGSIWPWRTSPLVVAAPVGSGGEILGVVVTMSPVGRSAGAVGTDWLVLAALGAVVLAICIAVAWALARWTLRPVAELDAAAQHIRAGDYGARVAAVGGPAELRRLTSAFNEMAATVSEALERQRAFVAQASHQLRNPLTALRLRVEDLGDDLESADVRERHRLALEETERLGHVLDSLLALARAERGQHRLEPVDAAEVARTRVVAWQPVAVRQGVELRYEPPEGDRPVRAVATALDQALDALIDNAMKFAGAGAQVAVRVDVADGGVLVRVTDDGPGLPAEQLELATDRFWRAPTTQNVDGSGLGLPIVAVIAEVSGGRFDLAPAYPQGLEARLWLPPDGGA
ncbi:MAG: ATP-binding protein [Micromonosporaceae bacterium]